MRATSLRVAVCPDCAAQFPPESDHSCDDTGQRLAVELLDNLIETAESGIGLLWLYRIAYRVRARRNGLEKYADRAALARRACELGGVLG